MLEDEPLAKLLERGGGADVAPRGATSELMAAACGSSYLVQSPASPINVVLIVS